MNILLRYFTSLIIIISVSHSSISQPCITAASPTIPGYCNNDSILCDQKNFNVDADFRTDLFDYKLINVSEYASLQGFGKIGNAAPDLETLSCRIYLPENAHILRPVIMFSSLSSFTSSKVIGSLQNYFCSYFAKKGFVVVAYESRKFNIDRSVILPTSVLTDFITNPYYTSDTIVLNDFIDFRNNNPTQDYKFADLLISLAKANNGSQLAHDAYMEMVYKITYDTKHLLELLAQNQASLHINSLKTFLVGGSAASVQSLHAGFLEHPDMMDSIFDTVAMTYKGMNFPSNGNLSDDFPFEPNLVLNIRPIGVVNFWGFISSLDIIDENDPSVFNAHGTWDHIFSYQITYQEQLQKWFGYGAEAIFSKASTEGLHTDLFSVCRGKHALYPTITGCEFKRDYEEDLFHDLLRKLNAFFIEHGSNSPDNDIYAINTPVNYRSILPPVTLKPSSLNLISDSNDHCPITYPDHFNLQLFRGNPNSQLPTPPQKSKEKPTLNLIQIADPGIMISPNPFSEDLLLDIILEESSKVDLLVFDISGKLLASPYKNHQLDQGWHKLDLKIEGLSSGSYIVNVILDDKMRFSEPVVKF